MGLQNQSHLPDSWEEVKTELFKFSDVGEELVGLYVDSEYRKGTDGRSDNFVYSVKTDSGELVQFFGSAILNNRMRLIPVNTRIRIVFEDLQPSADKKKNDTKIFRVYTSTAK